MGGCLPNKLARGPKWSSYATAKNYDFALCLLFTFFVWINIIASLISNRTSILKRRPHYNNIIHSYAAPYNNTARRGRAEVARPSCLPKQARAPARTPISISLWRPITRRLTHEWISAKASTSSTSFPPQPYMSATPAVHAHTQTCLLDNGAKVYDRWINSSGSGNRVINNVSILCDSVERRAPSGHWANHLDKTEPLLYCLDPYGPADCVVLPCVYCWTADWD